MSVIKIEVDTDKGTIYIPGENSNRFHYQSDTVKLFTEESIILIFYQLIAKILMEKK